MGALDGRIAVITGAGRGLGREHALLFAREGAKVVVNDTGGGPDGVDADVSAAQLVVDEIAAQGGVALANTESVADWNGAARMIDAAIEAFGDLHVLVNNAGILRPELLVDTTEEAWRAVIDVHLNGTCFATKHAAAHFRAKAKEGRGPVDASIVCTASGAGLWPSTSVNYAAAKAGIVSFAMLAAKELSRYGVRVNTIAPMGRTRLTTWHGPLASFMKEPDEPAAFDTFDPANVSPLVAYLATADCPYTGGVWHVFGGHIDLCEGWRVVSGVEKDDRWTIEGLEREVPAIVGDRASTPERLLSEGSWILPAPADQP